MQKNVAAPMRAKSDNRFVAALAVCSAALAFVPGSTAIAGPTVTFGEDQSITVGAGIRVDNQWTSNGAPNKSGSDQFNLESARIFLNGQVSKVIGVTLNTEIDRGDNDRIRILDAIARFEFNDYFNIYAGRMLPPSDRSNLDGPYYLGTWNFPLVQAYPAKFAGRDDGAAVFGQVGGGKFKYAVGAYNGCKSSNAIDGTDGCRAKSNTSDNLLYAGRLTYNFWDPEPGYYTSSDYYGSKEILAIGLVGQFQSDATGTVAKPSDYAAWNVDALMQHKLGNGGVFTLEGAYYDYNLNGGANIDLAGGKGYFGLVSYLFPQEVGVPGLYGKLQPVFRYEQFNRNDGAADQKQYDIGVNYIVKEHNARGAITYSNTETNGAETVSKITTGIQLQF